MGLPLLISTLSDPTDTTRAAWGAGLCFVCISLLQIILHSMSYIGVRIKLNEHGA